jgi:hypothetical protein
MTVEERPAARPRRSFWDGHAERALERDFAARGVRRHWVAPPLYRLLWRLRVPLRPPLFQSFGAVFATMGGWFAASWGAVMQLFASLSGSTDLGTFGVRPVHARLLVWAMAAAVGVFFGLCMAATMRWKARSLKVPPWEQYSAVSIAQVFT